VQQSELRMLLADCARLWGVAVRLEPAGEGIAVHAARGRFILSPAAGCDRPVRWRLVSPGGRERALPSIIAALTALRTGLSRG
jgi:hypothetical protein